MPGGPAPGSALGKSLPLPPRTWQDQVRMVLYFIFEELDVFGAGSSSVPGALRSALQRVP